MTNVSKTIRFRALALCTTAACVLGGCASSTPASQQSNSRLTPEQRVEKEPTSSGTITPTSGPSDGVSPTPLPATYTPTLVATPTSTPSATQTAQPTTTYTPTAIPPTVTSTRVPATKTVIPTQTSIPYYKLIRPVDASVPIYHAYGIPTGVDPAHNGFDYGRNSCADRAFSFPAVAVGSGVIIHTGDILPGVAERDLWIDLGVGRLTDERIVRLIATYWHGAPLPGMVKGTSVSQGQVIYSSIPCETNGHPSEVELQIIAVPPDTPRNAARDMALRAHNKNGEFPHIDPALAGISPN